MTGSRRDASGDRLARLYDRFAGTLFRHAALILADRVAAADAVHNVFLKLAKGGLGADVEPLAYLRQAVRNECYSVLRTRRRDVVVGVDAQLLEALAGVSDQPAERLALEQALQQLPAEQREVVHLKVWEGMTFQELVSRGDCALRGHAAAARPRGRPAVRGFRTGNHLQLPRPGIDASESHFVVAGDCEGIRRRCCGGGAFGAFSTAGRTMGEPPGLFVRAVVHDGVYDCRGRHVGTGTATRR